MAQFTKTFFTDPGTGAHANTGSAHVASANTPNVFGSNSATGWVGRAAKNGPEVNVFLRFHPTNAELPLGSRIDGANLRLTTNAAATATGGLRIGALISTFDSNAKAERNGWRFDIVAPIETDSFSHAYHFSSPTSNAPAHVSNNNTLNKLTGRTWFNNWVSNTDFIWTGIGSGVQIHWGDGIGGEDQIMPVDGLVSLYLNRQFAGEASLWTFDSQAVSNADDRLKVHLDPTALDANKPALVVKYTENFPDFTITPSGSQLEADATCDYTITITADPYDTAGDQTAGLHLDLVFSLTTFPTGMTIVPATGVIEWTPTLAQEDADHDVVVRVENEGGLFAPSDLEFTITVADTVTPVINATATGDDLTAESTCAYTFDADGTITNAVEGCQDDTIDWTLETFPTGMSIDSDGLVTWTPTVAQQDTAFAVTVRATNFADKNDELDYTVTVGLIGTPSFISSPPLTGEEEKLYVYDADAVPGTAACQDQTVTFSLIVGPPGMVMDPVTGVLSWTPGLGDAGNHDVTIRVVNFIPSNTTDQSFIIFIHVQQPAGLADPTLTGIANCALISLGEPRIRSLDDTVLGAQLIRDRFDDVRDELIRLFPWDFAKTRARLAANATPPIGDFAGFTYAYPLPFDFVRLIEVLTPAHHAYRVEGGQILTHNEAPLEIVYLRSVTNPGEMDVLFRETLCASLAFEIAAAITDNSDKIAAAATRFLAKLRDARRASGQEEEPEDQGGEFGGWLEFRGSDKRREDR